MLFDRMSAEMVKAMIEAIPAEVTVIDANDEVVGWNKHDKRLFHRPMTCIGMNFRDCHPKKSLDQVERLVGEMKSGKRDKATFWIDLPVGPEKKVHKILIEFYALRGDDGKYLGCLEFTQDVQEIRELEGQKRLMD
ncbi:MAG TPA: PAS domain-containing protein [Elusimicrobiales bacterium]|nr:PAS domain-containing protein [Elusimicrobiales bacterium]